MFAFTMSTINDNDYRVWLHPSVFKRQFALMKDKGVEKTGKLLADLTAVELKDINKKAAKATKEAVTGDYMMCLFLLLTNNKRCSLLKTQLDNTFLMGEQGYPSNILTAKRLMTDVFPAAGATKHQQKPKEHTNMAFVETQDKGDYNPICYCCRKRNLEGYLKICNVTDAVQEQTIKTVDSGHFYRGQHQNNNNTIITKGTNRTNKKSASKKEGTFIMAKKDNGENEEEEEKDSTLPTYEEYLCENGVISLNIGGVGGVDPVFGGD